MALDPLFVAGVCKSCPFSLLAGGEGGSWTVQRCTYQFAHDGAGPHKGNVEHKQGQRMEDMVRCPHPVRSARAMGAL